MSNSEFVDILVALEADTPFFIYDLQELSRSLDRVRNCADEADCKLLYSVKACSCGSVLKAIGDEVHGFSCSSPFEVFWAKECGLSDCSIHFTSPGIRPSDIELLGENCDYLAVNSMSQWNRLALEKWTKTNCGIRLNPKLSFVEDKRYNPCRKHSKLGVGIKELRKCLTESEDGLRGVTGFHFHSNCDSEDFEQLLATVSYLDSQLGDLLTDIDWINLGGGYLFDSLETPKELIDSVAILKSKSNLDVFIEPGAGIVRSCGFLVSAVIDLFESDGKKIAVLDTTVNHLPEVFEYQYSPDIVSENVGGEHEYILAGSTCLSGDIFGEYSFDRELELGQRIIFTDVGAYSLVKANMFNGISLPDVYIHGIDGVIKIEKSHSYADFHYRLVGDARCC